MQKYNILHRHADSTSDSDAQLGNSSSSYHTLISNPLQEKPTLHCSMSRPQTQAQKTVQFFFLFIYFLILPAGLDSSTSPNTVI